MISWFIFGSGARSHIATRLVLVVLVGATASKKAQGSVVSNQIGMKFGRIVPPVNTHRLTELDVRVDLIILRRQPRRHFGQIPGIGLGRETVAPGLAFETPAGLGLETPGLALRFQSLALTLRIQSVLKSLTRCGHVARTIEAPGANTPSDLMNVLRFDCIWIVFASSKT